MSQRKKAEPVHAVTPRKASIYMERAGLSVRIDNVAAESVGEVAADLLDVFRLLRQVYPEVIAELGSVHGGTPVEVTDDEWSDEGRGRVGFRTPRALAK